MSSEIEALIAAFGKNPPHVPSQAVCDDQGSEDMEFDVEAELAKRQKSVQRILAKADPERMKAGIEAYKLDLPKLLRDGRERQVVAYDGEKRVGIAQTLEELDQNLKQDGVQNRGSLFIKHVLPSDDDGENLHAYRR